MLIAVVSTLLRHEVVSYEWIVIGLLVGTVIGIPIAVLMPMTAVPQRTAISQACGAPASALIGTAEFYKGQHGFTVAALMLETLLGFLTVTASIMAWGKLQEFLPGRPITFKGQIFFNLGILGLAIALAIAIVVDPAGNANLYPYFIALALTFGVLLIVPIGGADMPTVIALLNSYVGLSACAMGFALDNNC